MLPQINVEHHDEENVAPDVIPQGEREEGQEVADAAHNGFEDLELNLAPTATSQRSGSVTEGSTKSLKQKKSGSSSHDDNHGHHHLGLHLSNSHGMQLVKSAAQATRRKLHLDSIHASGPSSLFNPTTMRMHVRWKEEGGDKGDSDTTVDERAYLWRARDNRKGRHSIAVPTAPERRASTSIPHAASGLKQFIHNFFKMLFSFNYWDMAWWSGWGYTWGSVLFILDGAWSFTDVAFPGKVPSGLLDYAGPLCFFIGALLYEIGATMAYLEAVNDGSFQGSAMRRFLEGNEDDAKRMLDEKIHTFFSNLVHHRHRDEEAVKAPLATDALPRRGAIDLGEAEEGTTTTYMRWRWWPTWHTLRTHHVYEIGYIACAIQLFGATLYAMCGVVALPGILSSLEHWQEEAAYWVPQIVASCCFLTAGILFTLETQVNWWKPEPKALGWWIGFWATVGSMGFLLCAIFGAIAKDASWAEYQSDISSTWGSFAYLVSGGLQWYEGVNKRPVEELFDEAGPMKSFQVHI